jgi:hypothetical protein
VNARSVDDVPAVGASIRVAIRGILRGSGLGVVPLGEGCAISMAASISTPDQAPRQVGVTSA